MKKIFLTILIIAAATVFTACNKQIIDLNNKYDVAIIQLPNGEVVEGKVEKWKDYEGDQLQITIDGKVYLVHSMNVALIYG